MPKTNAEKNDAAESRAAANSTGKKGVSLPAVASASAAASGAAAPIPASATAAAVADAEQQQEYAFEYDTYTDADAKADAAAVRAPSAAAAGGAAAPISVPATAAAGDEQQQEYAFEYDTYTDADAKADAAAVGVPSAVRPVAPASAAARHPHLATTAPQPIASTYSHAVMANPMIAGGAAGGAASNNMAGRPVATAYPMHPMGGSGGGGAAAVHYVAGKAGSAAGGYAYPVAKAVPKAMAYPTAASGAAAAVASGSLYEDEIANLHNASELDDEEAAPAKAGSIEAQLEAYMVSIGKYRGEDDDKNIAEAWVKNNPAIPSKRTPENGRAVMNWCLNRKHAIAFDRLIDVSEMTGYSEPLVICHKYSGCPEDLSIKRTNREPDNSTIIVVFNKAEKLAHSGKIAGGYIDHTASRIPFTMLTPIKDFEHEYQKDGGIVMYF